MVRSMIMAVAFGVAAAGYAYLAVAQKAQPPIPTSASGLGRPAALDDQYLQRYEKIVEGKQNSNSEERERAKEETARLLGALGLPCRLTDAQRVGVIRNKPDVTSAAEVNIYADGKGRVYEISCSDGTGYFLVSRGGQKPVAISCFAADATHAADVAQGVKSDFYCMLPANKDVKAMASSLMSRAGTACDVSNVRWLGLDAANEIEYSEVACADGKGYVLKLPQTATTAQSSVLTCQQALQNGLNCRLTDGGSAAQRVTMQTFIDSLKDNGVNCRPAQMRVIGRERLSRRYVIEVQCPERPQGLVAFIPVQDNTNKFETIDCAEAGTRDIACKFISQ